MNENYTVKAFRKDGTVKIVAENLPYRSHAVIATNKIEEYLGCVYTKIEVIDTITNEIAYTLKPKARKNNGITIRNNVIKGWY